MSIDDTVDPGSCAHEPGRLYIWRLEEDSPRNLYATCARCKSDYRIPNDEIVRRCTEPDATDPPFHVRFREACEAYRKSNPLRA